MNRIVEAFLTKDCMQRGEKEANCGTLRWRYCGNDKMYKWEGESCINLSFHDLSLISVRNSTCAVTFTAAQGRVFYTPLSLPIRDFSWAKMFSIAGNYMEQLYHWGALWFHTLFLKNPSISFRNKGSQITPCKREPWNYQFWYGFLFVCSCFSYLWDPMTQIYNF